MSRAFSLIELMVVIAIVAILAGVAVPYYKEYIARAKVASLQTAMEGLILEAKEFYEINGFFPSIDDLGYAAVGDPTLFDDPTIFHEDLEIFLFGSDEVTNCAGGGDFQYLDIRYGLRTNVDSTYPVYFAGFTVYKRPDSKYIENACYEAQITADYASLNPSFSGYLNCTYANGETVTDANIGGFWESCAQDFD